MKVSFFERNRKVFLKSISQNCIFELKITLIGKKCVPVPLSGNYLAENMKLVKMLDPLILHTPVISVCISSAV